MAQSIKSLTIGSKVKDEIGNKGARNMDSNDIIAAHQFSSNNKEFLSKMKEYWF